MTQPPAIDLAKLETWRELDFPGPVVELVVQPDRIGVVETWLRDRFPGEVLLCAPDEGRWTSERVNESLLRHLAYVPGYRRALLVTTVDTMPASLVPRLLVPLEKPPANTLVILAVASTGGLPAPLAGRVLGVLEARTADGEVPAVADALASSDASVAVDAVNRELARRGRAAVRNGDLATASEMRDWAAQLASSIQAGVPAASVAVAVAIGAGLCAPEQ